MHSEILMHLELRKFVTISLGFSFTTLVPEKGDSEAKVNIIFKNQYLSSIMLNSFSQTFHRNKISGGDPETIMH